MSPAVDFGLAGCWFGEGNRPDVVAAARAWMGTPYAHQASLRGAGCDCLGLVRGLWRDVVGPEPLPVPPYSPDWCEVGGREVLIEALGQAMTPCTIGSAPPGALLVFRMRRRAVAKHCGVLSAAGRMIHARERLGVIEEALTPFWTRRIVAAFAFPEPR